MANHFLHHHFISNSLFRRVGLAALFAADVVAYLDRDHIVPAAQELFHDKLSAAIRTYNASPAGTPKLRMQISSAIRWQKKYQLT